ncbi:SEFIR domain-containing protein [Leptospira yasudae]|uniref:SEFIR domain-containing protein n=1 Tax=Leptospira yasudae TaxID=2202201 RepID=UPI0010916A58|nr:SEFIR domain-containing protein [Leptospira yasudae]TGM99679.1 hypothetical protein EHR10_08795 [Leptospira yasudae]
MDSETNSIPPFEKDTGNQVHPKVFISYCWSSVEHEYFVIELATELRVKFGIDIILDKWDLKEGHDKLAFMEQKIREPDIKVLMICDKKYKEKADSREGGVGTEAQIITPNLYKQSIQSKFVAVVVENDEDGEACLPVYYESRVYIDLRDAMYRKENIDKIVAWSYGKDLYPKPTLGEIPSIHPKEFSIVKSEIRSASTVEIIRGEKSNTNVVIEEYLERFLNNLESIRISKDGKSEFIKEIEKNIEDFLPVRNEILNVILQISKSNNSITYIKSIHKFFEKLIPFQRRPDNVMSYNDSDYDNYKFIIQELFLYTIASLLKYEKFIEVNLLLSKEYYYMPEDGVQIKDSMKSFTVLSKHISYFEMINRNASRQHSPYLQANLLKERSANSGISSKDLMQADLLLFLRGLNESDGFWKPTVLYFLAQTYNPIEMFARSKSSLYFERIKLMLGIESKKQLGELLEKAKAQRNGLLHWTSYEINFNILTAFDIIETSI